MKTLATLLSIVVLAVSANASQPNILLIVSDDQGYADAGFQGCKDIPTPHLDRLARAGLRDRSDELYNLAADRNEATDLAEKLPDEVKRLEAIFQSQWTPNTDYPMYPPKKKANR